jgi:hypothetical protein
VLAVSSGALPACGPTGQGSADEPAKLFEAMQAIQGVLVHQNSWIGWGEGTDTNAGDVPTMTALGASRTNGRWTVSLLQPIVRCEPSQGGFDPTSMVRKAPSLTATGPSLVARCFTGGTNEASVVAAVGLGTSGKPNVMLAIDCGITALDLKEKAIVIHRADLAEGSGRPLQNEHDFELQAVGRSADLAPTNPADVAEFRQMCHKVPTFQASM